MLEWGNLDKQVEGAISPQTPQQAPPSQSPQSSQQQQQQQQLFQSDMALVSPTSALSPDLHSGIRRANSAGGGFAGGGAARHWPSSGAHDTPQRGRSERSLRSEKVRKRLKARLEAKLEAELEIRLTVKLTVKLKAAVDWNKE